ncbi:hypothetical protein T484DRAFT_3486494 [Baffinella frigidus]|nr:hypothetical protein T484DRAFT_3486494 [Cryptophyta sp. CCMP2293]
MVQARANSHREGKDEENEPRINTGGPKISPGPSWAVGQRGWKEEIVVCEKFVKERMDVEERRKERMTPRRSAGHVGLILAALVALLRVNGVKAVDGTHITTTTPKNGPLSGGQSLTLSGQEFGAYSDQQHVRLGGSAVSATAWVSATSIVVTVPNGISMQKTVVLTMPG